MEDGENGHHGQAVIATAHQPEVEAVIIQLQPMEERIVMEMIQSLKYAQEVYV